MKINKNHYSNNNNKISKDLIPTNIIIKILTIIKTNLIIMNNLKNYNNKMATITIYIATIIKIINKILIIQLKEFIITVMTTIVVFNKDISKKELNQLQI